MPAYEIPKNDFSFTDAPLKFTEADLRAIMFARQQARLQPGPGMQDDSSAAPVDKSPEEQ